MNEEEIDTIIGDDIVFKGSLRFSHSLQIKGQFKGTIESNGKLMVSETGNVEADIIVGNLSVDGSIKGNIEAQEKVQMGKAAIVTGDVKTPLLEIQIGAKFSGNCIM
ncbi:MAG: polymer-forming cytoskeletal protein [Leptospiraceae bacterium]|nr:polymer-forming cytoskeletal protein [Leptospiraceae bacterium]MCP5493745.1 polymer-forming cytoskeletal protein [Leptospiraceae bacterium]